MASSECRQCGRDLRSEKEKALHYAAFEGNLEFVKFLIAHGWLKHIDDVGDIDYNTVCEEEEVDDEAGYNYKHLVKQTPLYLACKHGHWDVVKFLMEQGAKKYIALIMAAENGDVRAAQYLVKKGANCNRSWEQATPLCIAAENGKKDFVRFLVEKGADKDKADNDGNTPLFHAVNKNRADVALYLLEQKADKNKANRYGYTPLHICAHSGGLEMVRLLIERGADKEAVDRNGNTPLHDGARQGHLEVVRLLLEQGADRDKANDRGETPLHVVALAEYRHEDQDRLEILKLLMVYGADLNARNNRGQLPIGVARTEEIKQAIRDEPRRRMDERPGKRAAEEDRHPNASASANAQQDDEGVEEDVQSNKRPRIDAEVAEAEKGKVAEED